MDASSKLCLICRVVLAFVFACVLSQASLVDAVFTPRSYSELKSAVKACLATDPTGKTCEKDGTHISRWNTARITSFGSFFGGLFSHASAFNGDVSRWNTARVTMMHKMFAKASSFCKGHAPLVSSTHTVSTGYMFYECCNECHVLLDFLLEHRLGSYFDKLVDNGFDSLDDLAECTQGDLVEMGISKMGHRKRLLRAIRERTGSWWTRVTSFGL